MGAYLNRSFYLRLQISELQSGLFGRRIRSEPNSDRIPTGIYNLARRDKETHLMLQPLLISIYFSLRHHEPSPQVITTAPFLSHREAYNIGVLHPRWDKETHLMLQPLLISINFSLRHHEPSPQVTTTAPFLPVE